MKRVYRIAFVMGVSAVLLLALSASAFGQDFESVRSVLDKQIADKVRTIGEWNRQASILIALSVTVGVLGLVMGVLQAAKDKWCKVTTVVLGLVISGITIINATVFHCDYRTFKRNAVQARLILDDVNFMLAGFPSTSNEDKKTLLGEIIKKLKEIGDIEVKMLDPAVSQFSLDFSTPVFAQSKQPDWVSKPPLDTINYYFVGRSDNQSLSSAKEDSRKQAVEQATAQALSNLKTRLAPGGQDSVREYVLKNAEVSATWYSYNSGAQPWSYFTLLKINRVLFDVNIIQVYSVGRMPLRITIEQRHRKTLGRDFQDKLAVYVADIHKSKPFTVIVYKVGPENPAWQDSTRISLDEVKKRLPVSAQLFAGSVSGTKKEPISFTWNNTTWVLNWSIRTSTIGTDYFDAELARR